MKRSFASVLVLPLIFALSSCSYIKTIKTKEAAPESKYLAVWTGDEDGKDSDFLTIIDTDPESKTYGHVIRTVTLPEEPGAHLLAVTGFGNTPKDFPSHRLNEPHHLSENFTKDHKLFAGGLISGNVFRFDLADPLNVPKPDIVIKYGTESKFSGPDDLRVLSNGNIIATFMGSGGKTLPPALTTPGGIVEFSSDGSTFKEYEAALPDGPKHYRTSEDTGLLANPHGIDIREDLNIMITSDFADPVSLAVADFKDEKQKFRSTLRVWDLKERKVKKVVQMPDGPRKEEKGIHEEPEGLMAVRLLQGKNQKGAFTASMSGGALFYSADVTVENPVFKQVYDFGGSAGVSVFSITSDDKYIVLPISGIRSPEEGAAFDPNRNARKIVQLDLTPLINAGEDFKCSGDDLNAPDCPKLVSELNADSPLNFATNGGPHVLILDKGDARLAFVNYFVDLKPGFGLPGTGSCGDHRLYMVKRAGDKLVLDEDFRDEFDGQVGVNFNRVEWPHGKTGNAKPHGLVFR